MKKQKFIFRWKLSIGYDAKTNTFSEENRKPITCIGTDSIKPIDGRLSNFSIKQIAEKWIKEKGGIGYSVGYLVSHDPEERLSQSIIKLKLI